MPGERPPARHVAAALDAVLERRGAGVRVARIGPVLGGLETHIYRLELAASGAVDGSLPVGQPLILRLGWRSDAAVALRWEAQAMAAARAAGVPAPRVYVAAPSLPGLSGALLLMEQVAGRRFDQAALHADPVALVRMIRAFARVQASIYRVRWRPQPGTLPSLAGSALVPSASLEERLAALEGEIEARRLSFLRPVITWLRANRAAIQGRPRVFLHGDYHPLNVFVDGARVSGVLDWSASGFGDRHEDVGWTSMLIGTVTTDDPAEDRRLAFFRRAGRWLYLTFLHDACRLDRAALRYGEVSGALRFLLIFLPSHLPDAGAPVLNADARAFITRRYINRVCRFIEKRTELGVCPPRLARLDL